MTVTETAALPAGDENFASLLEESLKSTLTFEHTVVKGRVVGIEGDYALVDVGLKAEGRVALKEFGGHGGDGQVAIGDAIDVYVERIEDKNGEAVLSREKARREEAWTQLEKAFKENQRVNGIIFGRVEVAEGSRMSRWVRLPPASFVARPVWDVPPDFSGKRLVPSGRRRACLVSGRSAGRVPCRDSEPGRDQVVVARVLVRTK